jgi:hypothetical protein
MFHGGNAQMTTFRFITSTAPRLKRGNDGTVIQQPRMVAVEAEAMPEARAAARAELDRQWVSEGKEPPPCWDLTFIGN